MKAFDIILEPVLTEKCAASIQTKKYVFKVAKDSNKAEIKKAIEEIYGVKVEKVNTVIIKGKYKRRGRAEGYTSDYKKAYVQLSEGTIEFFDSLQ